MPRSLLITGATGGLGLALTEAAIAMGYKVRATGRSAAAGERLKRMGAEFMQADLTDEAVLASLCHGCSSVIHAAALSASWGPAEAFERVNLQATATLLDAARDAGCSRFVFVSSPSIYAGFSHRLKIRNSDAPGRPLNDYARTKLAAERLVLAANSASMLTCAVRPRALVGPDDKVLLPALVALARRRRLPLPGGGAAMIELTDVRDAASAILAAEEAIEAIAGTGVNVSGGRPTSVREVAASLSAELGLTPRILALPVWSARIIARLLEGRARLLRRTDEPLLTRYAVATLAFSQTFELSETERLIGYRPVRDALATVRDEARKLRR